MSNDPLPTNSTSDSTTHTPSVQPEKQRRKFVPQLYHLYPIFFSFAVTGILGIPFYVSGFEPQKYSNFPDTYAGASLNALVFIATLTASATGMLLLVKRRKKRTLQSLVKAGLILMSFVVTLWYGTYVALIIDPSTDFTLQLLVISAAVAGALALLVYGKNKTLQALGVTTVGASTGLFLGESIPLLTAFAIILALVAYDTVSVFKGPIGALAKSVEIGDLTGAVFTYRDLTIGMGDIVFYSLVEAIALLQFGVIPFFAAGIGVIVGAYLGFKALSRFQVFPGLPFALLLGTGAMFGSVLALGVPIVW